LHEFTTCSNSLDHFHNESRCKKNGQDFLDIQYRQKDLKYEISIIKNLTFNCILSIYYVFYGTSHETACPRRLVQF